MSRRIGCHEFDAPEDRVITSVIRRQAETQPDAPAVLDGTAQLTYAELDHQSRVIAARLSDSGVKPGDSVLLMLDNHLDYCLAFIALAQLGALEVPVNTAYRGSILAHVTNDSGAATAIVEDHYLERFVEIGDHARDLSALYVRGHLDDPPTAFALRNFTELSHGDPLIPDKRKAWDPLGILYTSGTTGNSKGVLVPHGLAYSYSSMEWIDPGERIMVNLPMFHIGGQWAGVFAAMMGGGSAVIMPRFSATTFWQDARRFGCTQTVMLGAMASFLAAQEPRPDDADHPLRKVAMVPVTPSYREFSQRFGVTIGSAYGLTEFSSPIVTPYGEAQPGLGGWLRKDFEARVVDDHDLEVPPGVTGELVLRARTPWAMFSGYHGLPEATREAWQNLWFHTGDAMKTDSEGRYFFIDRKKDALRVRGENVSSFEVEGAILAHPDVESCAVVAVPSEHSEDDIKAIVVPSSSSEPDYAELISFLVDRLPYFMVPRYIEYRAALPVTPTQKVKKAELRSEGVTLHTWDREAAGLRVTRDGLTSIGPDTTTTGAAGNARE